MQVKDPHLEPLLTMRRVVYSLVIINKAGGLVYNRDFNSALNKVSVNDLLVLAGTFHGYAPFSAVLRTHDSIEADRRQCPRNYQVSHAFIPRHSVQPANRR